MEVATLPSVNGISGNPGGNKELSEETFLQLLSTQLQYQDPLEPASDVEFIQQMATFAQLEQQRITNSNLNVIQLYQSSLNNSNALNIVGKEVKLQDGLVEHEGEGQSHKVTYQSDSEAAKVTIRVVDDKGREVYSSTQVGAPDGEQEFIWRGVDEDGNPVEPGQYRIEVSLFDDEGNEYDAPVFQRKKVSGIAYENGSILLLVGDRRMPIESVVEVYDGEATAPEGERFKTYGYHNPYQVIAGGI